MHRPAHGIKGSVSVDFFESPFVRHRKRGAPVVFGAIVAAAAVLSLGLAYGQTREGAKQGRSVPVAASGVIDFQKVAAGDMPAAESVRLSARVPHSSLPEPAAPALPRPGFAVRVGGMTAGASPRPAASFSGGMGWELAGVQAGVGPEQLIVAQDSGLSIQDRSGGVLARASLGGFWSAVRGDGASGEHDPQIVYDPMGKRWITVAVDGNLLVGATRTSNAAGEWMLERIDREAGNELESPVVAFSGDWIAVGVKVWKTGTQEMVESRLYVMSKAELYGNGSATARVFRTKGNGKPVRSLDGDVGKLYVVEYASGVARVGAISGPLGAETLSGEEAAYASGTDAGAVAVEGVLPQAGTEGVKGNGRSEEDCEYRNHAMWCASAVTVAEGGRTRQSIEWVEFDPETGEFAQIGRVDDPAGRVFYGLPSIAVNGNNDVLVGYTSFTVSGYPGANLAFRYGWDPAGELRTGEILKDGEGPVVGTGMGGGVSATAVDPADDRSMWTLQSYGVLAGGGERRTGLWWGEVAPPAAGLKIAASHSGIFLRGQRGAYTITVTNGAGAGTTSGTVTMSESLPAGLTLVAMSGTGWTCTISGGTCVRKDVLGGGESYPPVQVTVEVSADAPALVANVAGVTGGGTATPTSAIDHTIVAGLSPCDINGDGNITVLDVQQEINEVLNLAPRVNDLNGDGQYTVADVQIVVNGTLGLGCVASTPSLTITTSSLPNGQVGTAYSQTIAITGGIGPFNWSQTTGLPNGLSIGTTSGSITGTPLAAGTSTVNLKVTDSSNPVKTATASLSLIVAGLTITTSSLPNGTTGAAYSTQLTASNGAGTLTWTAGTLPGGLTLSSAGVLSGTPTVPGGFTIGFTVKDSSNPQQTATKNLLVTIQAGTLTIVTSALQPGVSGSPYSFQLTGSGGAQPYIWGATPLPTGLILNASTGVISGTPTGTSTSVTITLTDSTTPTPNQQTTTLALLITSQGPTIIVTSATVGQNLEAPITITFIPALPNALTVTITSSDPGQVILGGAASVGMGTLSSTVSSGTGSISTWVQATGSIGSVITITASAPGYVSGTGTATIARSGFVVSGTSGIGGNFATYLGVTTTLTVASARLDASSLFVENQPVIPGLTVNVPVSTDQSSIGTITGSPAVFTGNTNTATVNFVAGSTNTGSTTVTAGPVVSPSFTTPAAGASLIVTVQSTGLTAPTATIGNNLETNMHVTRSGNQTTIATVTIMSNDPTKLLFSNQPTGNVVGNGAPTPPTQSITITIPSNQLNSPDFYAHVSGSSGSVTYTVSATGYGTASNSVTLVPSGLVIQSPFGLDTNFTMTVSTTAVLGINTAALDPTSHSPIFLQPVGYGQSVSVTVSSGDQTIGTVSGSPVVITTGFGADSSTTANFQATSKTGSTSITASSTGYQSASVTVTVSQSKLVVFDDGGGVIGQGLEANGTVVAPGATADTPVLLQSNSGQLLLSSDNVNWSQSLNITIHANKGNASFFIESLSSSGQGTITASTTASYGPNSDTIAFAPSGFGILDQVDSGTTGSTVPVSLSSGKNLTFSIYSYQLDSSDNIVTPQSVASNITVTFGNSTPATGTFPASLVVAKGTNTVNGTFTPKAVGTTTVTVNQPSGFVQPMSPITTTTLVSVTVNQ